MHVDTCCMQMVLISISPDLHLHQFVYLKTQETTTAVELIVSNLYLKVNRSSTCTIPEDIRLFSVLISSVEPYAAHVQL